MKALFVAFEGYLAALIISWQQPFDMKFFYEKTSNFS
jgi:hypothetical protein